VSAQIGTTSKRNWNASHQATAATAASAAI
jgi:hypothetical protein